MGKKIQQKKKKLTEIVKVRSQTIGFENIFEKNTTKTSLTEEDPVATKNLKKIYKQMKDLLDKDRQKKTQSNKRVGKRTKKVERRTRKVERRTRNSRQRRELRRIEQWSYCRK